MAHDSSCAKDENSAISSSLSMRKTSSRAINTKPWLDDTALMILSKHPGDAVFKWLSWCLRTTCVSTPSLKRKRRSTSCAAHFLHSLLSRLASQTPLQTYGSSSTPFPRAHRKLCLDNQRLNRHSYPDLALWLTWKSTTPFYSLYLLASERPLSATLVGLNKQLQNKVASLPRICSLLGIAIPKDGKQASVAQPAHITCVMRPVVSKQNDSHHLPGIVVATRSEWGQNMVSMLLLHVSQRMSRVEELANEEKDLFLYVWFMKQSPH